MVNVFLALNEINIGNIIDKLLEHKKAQQVSAQDGRGMTALHISVLTSQLKKQGATMSRTQEQLIKAGADVGLPDDQGRLPIHYAFFNRYK